jgi:hypothetical protein
LVVINAWCFCISSRSAATLNIRLHLRPGSGGLLVDIGPHLQFLHGGFLHVAWQHALSLDLQATNVEDRMGHEPGFPGFYLLCGIAASARPRTLTVPHSQIPMVGARRRPSPV